MLKNQKINGHYWFFLLLGVGGVFLTHSLIYSKGYDLHHDGIMYEAAAAVAQGLVPYRDFFFQYNLFDVLINGAIFKMFGSHVIELKFATVLTYTLSALNIYLLLARRAPLWIAALVAFLWAFMSPFFADKIIGYHPWPTVYVAYLVSCLMLCILSDIDRAKKYFILGFISAWIFWVKQNGLIFLVLFAFSAVLLRPRALILKSLALGAVVASLPFIIYITATHSFQDWFGQVMLGSMLWAASVNSSQGFAWKLFRCFLPVNRDIGSLSILFGILYPLTLWLLYNYRKAFQAKYGYEVFVLTLCAALASWSNFFPLPHTFHLSLNALPAFVILGLLVPMLRQDITNLATKSTCVRASIIVVFAFVSVATLMETMPRIKGMLEKQRYTEAIDFNEALQGLQLDHGTYSALKGFMMDVADLNGKSDIGIINRSSDPWANLVSNKVFGRYKMDYDWKWWNERYDAIGYKQKTEYTLLANAPLISDDFAFVPGYKLTKMERLNAPNSNIHLIYEPNANEFKLEKSPTLSEQNKDIVFQLPAHFTPTTTIFKFIRARYLNQKIPKRLIPDDIAKKYCDSFSVECEALFDNVRDGNDLQTLYSKTFQFGHFEFQRHIGLHVSSSTFVLNSLEGRLEDGNRYVVEIPPRKSLCPSSNAEENEVPALLIYEIDSKQGGYIHGILRID